MKLSLIPLIICIIMVPAATQNLFFSESEFKRSIQNALKSVKSILETTRNPVLLEDTDHTYQDKYALVEFVINSAIASYGNVLKHIGVKEDLLDQALRWTHESKLTVELEFVGTIWSDFVKEEERKLSVEEYEKKKLENDQVTTETFTVKRKAWDVHHTLNISFDLNLKCKDSSLSVMKHTARVPVVITHLHQGETRQLITSKCKEVLDLYWFLKMIPQATETSFIIDRQQDSCKTPSRNEDVKRAVDFATDLFRWSESMNSFMAQARRFLGKHDPNVKSLESSPPVVTGEDVFVPIVPFVENDSVLSKSDLNELLNLHVKTLNSVTTSAMEKYSKEDCFSSDHILLEVSVSHLNALPKRMMSSVAYVEHLLKTQLFQAIGKKINAEDFDKFMQFHNRKFFDKQYSPQPFSYSVRRPGFYPDGVISVESSDSEGFAPIETLVQSIPAEKAPSITIPVDAATSVDLEGQLYLHGWMQHVWQSGQTKSHQVVARAHQFSRFLLIVGTMGGPNVFLPKHAIILKDKDEVIIPLLTDILPSAKEFKDAIASLSPEQQEFAKAFRAMQLESSVFGICVIQLKPQLEKLLNLPENSLTKEIQLTQDLMSLFVDYQIPSDLLSFDGPDVLETREKVTAVKAHVEAVLNVIEGQKKKQLQDAKAQHKAEAMMADEDTVISWGQGQLQQQMQQQMMAGSSMPLPLPRMAAMDSRHIKKSRRLHAEPMLRETQSIMLDNFSIEGVTDAMPSDFESSIPGTQKEFGEEISSHLIDFTIIPKILDRQLEKHDVEGSLKSTILKLGEPWERLRKENLLVSPRRSYLSDRDREEEKHKAMDLLKALSRSGSLPIIQSELHVIISMSHCFDKDIVETVIEDNANPIQKVEKSMLMLGSVIHGTDKEKLLALPHKDMITEAET